MEITLPPELEKQVAAKVASGEYGSLEEMVSAGLWRLLDDEEFAEEEKAVMRAKIQEGMDELDRGESMDGDEFEAEMSEYIKGLASQRT